MAGWSAFPLFYWPGTLEHVLSSCLKTLRLQLCWTRDQILMDAASTGQRLAKKTKPSESFWFSQDDQKVIFGYLNPLQRFLNHIAVTSVCPDWDLRTLFPKQVALLLLTGGGVIKRLLVPRLLQLVQFWNRPYVLVLMLKVFTCACAVYRPTPQWRSQAGAEGWPVKLPGWL